MDADTSLDRDAQERAFVKFLVDGPGYPFDATYCEPNGEAIVPPVSLDVLAEAWCDWDEARWARHGMTEGIAPRDERVAEMRAEIGIAVGASPVVIEDIAA